jgi:hypothetical protein
MGIETALMVGGARMNAVSSYKNSASAKNAYGSQEQIAKNNAIIAGWQADDALARVDFQG